MRVYRQYILICISTLPTQHTVFNCTYDQKYSLKCQLNEFVFKQKVYILQIITQKRLRAQHITGNPIVTLITHCIFEGYTFCATLFAEDQQCRTQAPG